jgi:hypothetical protein
LCPQPLQILSPTKLSVVLNLIFANPKALELTKFIPHSPFF